MNHLKVDVRGYSDKKIKDDNGEFIGNTTVNTGGISFIEKADSHSIANAVRRIISIVGLKLDMGITATVITDSTEGKNINGENIIHEVVQNFRIENDLTSDKDFLGKPSHSRRIRTINILKAKE